MIKVTFNSERSTNAKYTVAKNKGLANWLTRKGLAKDRAAANKYLLITFVIGILIIIWLNWPTSAARMTPEQMQFETEFDQS